MFLPISSFKQDNPIEVEFVISLNKSIGKSILKYYSKQTTEDLAIAHNQNGPVDNHHF